MYLLATSYRSRYIRSHVLISLFYMIVFICIILKESQNVELKIENTLNRKRNITSRQAKTKKIFFFCYSASRCPLNNNLVTQQKVLSLENSPSDMENGMINESYVYNCPRFRTHLEILVVVKKLRARDTF